MPADPRYDRARAKLRRLMPPPAPNAGWGYARQRVEAQLLGPWNDDQATSAERQLVLGATMTRVDAAPANWASPEYSWLFAVTPEPTVGAQGRWLDIWGNTLGVHRNEGEGDTRYAPKILAEVTRPKTTNLGMADTLDDALGLTNTLVLDAWDYYEIPRYNDPGRRLNDGTILNEAHDLEGHEPWGMFVVVLYAGSVSPWLRTRTAEIVARAHAQGFRHWRTYGTPGAPVPSPSSGSATFTPTAPGGIGASVSDDSPTEAPATYLVSSPDGDPEGIALVTA